MRVGIIGGTFDPIHIVHLMIADHVRFEYRLDEIWFMPSYIPPHKTNKKVSAAEHRLNMIHLAIDGVPYFRVCNAELERKGTSYTVDTMKKLQSEHPNYSFYFLIGGDMVAYLPHWYKIHELVQLVQFIGVNRPGYRPSHSFEQEQVLFTEMPQMDISSTMIRERAKINKPIRFLVPDKVRLYIEENRLYET